MKAVVLDGYTLNPGDLSWDGFKSILELIQYDYTLDAEVVERALEAEILIVNKVLLAAETLRRLPDVKCILVTATGYNNVDIKYCQNHNIAVYHVAGYGTEAVAQHVFALILSLTNQVSKHNAAVKAGEWSKQPHFSFTVAPIQELQGKTLGIVGYGSIGKSVARIGKAFGMRILVHSSIVSDEVIASTIESLFSESDFISLHTMLTPEKQEMINENLLSMMKPSAYLINTARGGLINEKDLYSAVKSGKLAGACLDVLSQEPPEAHHPLFELENIMITPHMAWASREARQRLMDESVKNLKSFLVGDSTNRV